MGTRNNATPSIISLLWLWYENEVSGGRGVYKDEVLGNKSLSFCETQKQNKCLQVSVLHTRRIS